MQSRRGAPFYCEDVLKDKPLKEIKAFLESHKQGTYLAGSGSHIVLVVNGIVHDFTTAPRRGYNQRTVQEWSPASKLWTLGKPKMQF